jgi:predicted Zn-dependent protease
MIDGGYDPREMAAMFRTLERVSGTEKEGRPPEWLSTHPDPGNRVQRTEEKITATRRDFSSATINRDPFLRRLDGMVFGENPRQGFFEDARFLHPDLRLQLEFPQGWNTQNQVQAVIGMSSQQDALVTLTVAGREAPQQLASQFFGQSGVQVGQSSTNDINGLPAVIAPFTAQTQEGQLAGLGAFVALDGTTFRILAYTVASRVNAYDSVFQQTVRSFRRLTDQRALDVQPARIALVQLTRSMTLAQFYEQYPSTIPLAQLAIINGREPNAAIPGGTTLKRVVGGR